MSGWLCGWMGRWVGGWKDVWKGGWVGDWADGWNKQLRAHQNSVSIPDYPATEKQSFFL